MDPARAADGFSWVPPHIRIETGGRRRDTVFLLTTRGCFRNPTRDRGRIVGVATIVRPAEDLEEPVRFGDREFSVGVKLRIESLLPGNEGVELAPLIPKLRESCPNEGAWSARLRRASSLSLGANGVTLGTRSRPCEVVTGRGCVTNVCLRRRLDGPRERRRGRGAHHRCCV